MSIFWVIAIRHLKKALLRKWFNVLLYNYTTIHIKFYLYRFIYLNTTKLSLFRFEPSKTATSKKEIDFSKFMNRCNPIFHFCNYIFQKSINWEIIKDNSRHKTKFSILNVEFWWIVIIVMFQFMCFSKYWKGMNK